MLRYGFVINPLRITNESPNHRYNSYVTFVIIQLRFTNGLVIYVTDAP